MENRLHSQATESAADIERIALDAADAIRRLVAERHVMAGQAAAKDRELMRLRATNQELSRQIALIRECYVKLANQFVTQLKHIDDVIRTLAEVPNNNAGLGLHEVQEEDSIESKTARKWETHFNK
jgi:hypothetical protein